MRINITTVDIYDDIVVEYGDILRNYNMKKIEHNENEWSTRTRVVSIEINSLEQLYELSKQLKHPIIINDSEGMNVIYDGYI